MTDPNPYLAGRVRFMDVDMLIAPGALVPRAETELLGRTALGLLQNLPSGAEIRVIDMCCGSGNLSCALASNASGVRVWAADLTDGAIAVAMANVENLGLLDRVTVVQGDLFAPLAVLGLDATIDMVVCNPPYISSGKLAKESAELLGHEPREAFDGGPYGVSIFQRVIRDAQAFLKPGGTLLFEIGVGQGRQVIGLLERSKGYRQARTVADTGGEARVIVATKVEQS